MIRPRIAALVGLTLLAAPMVAGTAEAAVIVPPGNPMVGGSVACHLGVQTLRWWVSVTDHSGTVTAYASTGQTLHEETGSFVVHGPETVTLTEDNLLPNKDILESSATVVVPDASTCVVVTTTTTVPVTTTTVPATTTTKPPVVATTVPPPANVTTPPTAPPAAPAAVPVANVAQAQPVVALPTAPAQLAETGSNSWRLVVLAAILLALGLALVSGARRRTAK